MSENNELITVVVAVYNVKEYISECIDSIIHQTYGNLQILLVDDGSTDGSAELCDYYAISDKRIEVIHKENEGLSSARNIGIEHAKGKYIGFIDGDDFVNIHMFELLLHTILKYGTAIAECNSFSFTDQMEHPDSNSDIANYTMKTFDKNEWHLQTNLGTHYVACAAWNKLYDITLFDDIRYPKGMLHEDEATTYRLIEKAGHTVRIDAQLYYYRQRANSIVGTCLTQKRLEDNIKAFENKIDYFRQTGNTQVEAFSHARLCIMLIRSLHQTQNYSHIILPKLNENYRSAIFRKGVPLKYSAFIVFFTWLYNLRKYHPL